MGINITVRHLILLRVKRIRMVIGRPIGFTTSEIHALAEKYLHCSANWNSVIRDNQRMVTGAVKPAKLVTFTNRPDERWQRTVYDMDGNKIWK